MVQNYLQYEYCDPFDQKPQNFFMKLEHCGRYLYALDLISKKDIVADISCATGYGSNLLAQKAKLVLGCDINEKYLDLAQKKYQKKNLFFIKTDLTKDLNIKNYSVSTIISFETVEHTKNPFEVIKKFYNLLPSGGRLILSFPNCLYETLDENNKSLDPFHLSVIQYEEAVAFFKKTGFQINNFLGQTAINQIIKRVAEIEKDFNISLEDFCNYKKAKIIEYSRKLAYPNTFNPHESYSLIFDLIKKD